LAEIEAELEAGVLPVPEANMPMEMETPAPAPEYQEDVRVVLNLDPEKQIVLKEETKDLVPLRSMTMGFVSSSIRQVLELLDD
jgi:hypothetical protein